MPDNGEAFAAARRALEAARAARADACAHEAACAAAARTIEAANAAAFEAALAAARPLGRVTLAEAAAAAVRSGRIDPDRLAAAASAALWAHDALRNVAPARAAGIPEPKRRRGRDASANAIRDAVIRAEVKDRMGRGASLRAASKATAAGFPAFGNQNGNAWKPVSEIWRKRPNK